MYWFVARGPLVRRRAPEVGDGELPARADSLDRRVGERPALRAAARAARDARAFAARGADDLRGPRAHRRQFAHPAGRPARAPAHRALSGRRRCRCTSPSRRRSRGGSPSPTRSPPADTRRSSRMLRLHGVAVAALTQPLDVTVQEFVIDSVKHAERAFQGHHETSLTGKWRDAQITLPPGTLHRAHRAADGRRRVLSARAGERRRTRGLELLRRDAGAGGAVPGPARSPRPSPD